MSQISERWELVESQDSEGFEETLQEITRSHWVSSENQTNCANHCCRKKFTLLERKHHCRRCGKVFCNDCVSYKRRLNFLANYDPYGKFYRVCGLCFEEGKDVDLPTSSKTEEFLAWRRYRYTKQMMHQMGSTSLYKTSRERLDLNRECERLRVGFMKSVGSSEMKRTLQEMKVLISTPSWQKSSTWTVESLSEKCQSCSSGFNLMKKKYTCKLCGLVLCKACVHKELLVYIPDNKDEDTSAHLAIIKVVGSPEVEPEISLLLHVCSLCRQFVVNRQIAKAEVTMRSEVKDVKEELFQKLADIDTVISKLQCQINDQLTKYQDVVESLEDSRRSSGDGSNTKVLAKSQEDLSDYFAAYVLKLPSVKKLQDAAETNTQCKFCRNYLMAKRDFYIENTTLFKSLKRKLSESASPQILEYIQRIVDKHAIVSAQIYVRQMIFESLHLSQKHSLKSIIPNILKPLDETIEEDANKCLALQGEDIQEHKEDLQSIVIAQMKDHRLVKISKRQLAAQGSKHVAELLLRRLDDVLEKVSVQLNMKSINRSFQQTKSVLEHSRKEVGKLVVTDLM